MSDSETFEQIVDRIMADAGGLLVTEVLKQIMRAFAKKLDEDAARRLHP